MILTHEISLSKPATIIFKVTPILFETFIKDFHKLKAWKLNDTTTVKLVVEKLDLPLDVLEKFRNGSLDEINLEPVGLSARLEIGQTSFTNETIQRDLLVKDLQANIDSGWWK